MKSLKAFVFGAFGVISSMIAHAQQGADTVTHLQEVVVQQSRLDAFAIGHHLLRIDSMTRRLASAGTVADMMRKYGFGHIRSYGPGGLSTPSFHGTSANHTSVLWNGVSLQSTLNGQADFTLIPITFIDDVHIQTGGSASLYGSGAIGGTIHLNSQARFNQGLNIGVSSSAGSFSSYFNGVNFGASGKKFISSTKLFDIQAENNFNFINNNVSPGAREQMHNAAVSQHGILQQNYWQFLPGHLLGLRFWYQDNSIEVPHPTTVTRKAEAVQHDRFYRSMISWQLDRQNFQISYQVSHIHHLLYYEDPGINLYSNSLFDSFVNNLEGTFGLRPTLDAVAGLQFTVEEGKVDEFAGLSPRRNRMALFGALKFTPNTKWKSVASIRQELVSGKPAPVALSMGVDFSPLNKIRLFGNASRSYRIPTFNDLYWRGTGSIGNPALRSEFSWSEQLGVQLLSTKDSNLPYSIQTAFFNSMVDNWILWTPTARGWSPLNVKKVWSRGLESKLSLGWRWGRVSGDLNVLYSFTKSTNEAIYSNSNLNELNKQLILTPIHEGSATLRATWRKITLTLVNACTGKQYTDGDNSEFFAMKGYLVWSGWLSREVSIKKLKINATIEVNNLLDRNYESRPGYPLPGRNFKIGLSILFNKPAQHAN